MKAAEALEVSFEGVKRSATEIDPAVLDLTLEWTVYAPLPARKTLFSWSKIS